MATKKNSYITAELDWAEDQLKNWKGFIDANPIDKVDDRMAYKETKGGGTIPVCIQTREGVIKSITELMTKYLSLLEVVDKLREAEEEKKKIRGDDDLSPLENGQI